MNGDWFEMKDIRRRRVASAVWIPLRAQEHIIHDGTFGVPGYKRDIFAAGSLAVPMSKREFAKKLSWDDIGLSHEPGIWSEPGFYKPADIYWYNKNEEIGLELAMVQHFDGAEPRQWHLNQDLVFALSLLREGDSWVRPLEDYVEVARLRRNEEWNPVALEIKNEYLRDYLCARNYFLRLSWYRTRDVIVENPTDIGLPQEKRESLADERFELRVYPILEGGDGEGTVAVLNIARTDVDPDEDVPVLGPETNDNTESRSWYGTPKGKRIFRIEGEVWRDEEIEPSPHSPRVRHDKVLTGLSYTVDAAGNRMTSEELDDQDIGRWLWFRPSVVPELLRHRGTKFEWYTDETGGVNCGPGSLIHFGLNSACLVTVYAYDIATLDQWQQHIWAGYNVSPEGGVSKELLSAQMRTVVAKTRAPENVLKELLAKIDPLFVAAIGGPLFKPHLATEKIWAVVSRFRALERDGLFALAKDIMRLTVDRIDVMALQKIAPPPVKERWSSLKSLEKYLATLIPASEAREIMVPLFGVYELRLADAHLTSSDLEKSFKLVGIDDQTPALIQGYALISNVARTIWRIGDTVRRHALK